MLVDDGGGGVKGLVNNATERDRERRTGRERGRGREPGRGRGRGRGREPSCHVPDARDAHPFPLLPSIPFLILSFILFLTFAPSGSPFPFNPLRSHFPFSYASPYSISRFSLVTLPSSSYSYLFPFPSSSSSSSYPPFPLPPSLLFFLVIPRP